MRKISVLLCSFALMSSAVGCCLCECLNHTAGVCDCQNDPRGCDRYGLRGPSPIVATPVPATIVTPIPSTTAPAETPKLMPIPR